MSKATIPLPVFNIKAPILSATSKSHYGDVQEVNKDAKRKRPVATRYGEVYPSQYALRNDPYRRRQRRLYGVEKAERDAAVVESIYKSHNVSQVARTFGITRQRAHQILLNHYTANPDAERIELASQNDTRDKQVEWIISLYDQGYERDQIAVLTDRPESEIVAVLTLHRLPTLAAD